MGVVDDIKERLDIVEVISSYLPLQKSGRNFKALCPFHSEKTPSFYVFPDSQHWHCFGGCAEGGDVFSFVMKHQGWDFRTALEELARRAGVELRPVTPDQVERKEHLDQLRAALEEAVRYYHTLLLHAPEAETVRAYVARRGLTPETVQVFQLGYSLPGWDGLRAYLTGKGFTLTDLIDAGLLIEREDGTTYDRFRDRVMIPIRDARGQPIGFGARTLDPDGVPKYLNSPQTALFDKRRNLYGLDLAGRAIRDEDRAVIVEGYMDVMQAYQAGFRNVVAQMGTALTEHQVRHLQRYTRHFVLALDPDAAGVQATLRGLEVVRETLAREGEPVFDPRGLVGYEGRLGAEIRILSLPQGHDPDVLIKSDPERWAALVAEAAPVIGFMFQRLLAQSNPDDPKERAEIVKRMLPLLRDVPDPVEREAHAQQIARALGVQERTLMAQLHQAERQSAHRRQGVTGLAAAPPEQRAALQADLEGYFLQVLFRYPPMLRQVNDAFEEMGLAPVRFDDFDDPVDRALFEAWEAVLWEDEYPSVGRLWERVADTLFERLQAILSFADDWANERWAREGIRAALYIRKRNLKRRGLELQSLMEEAEWADVGASMNENAQTLRYVEQALARRWSAT
ncbi:MAG: DNA primase [Anaerolineae bacterium]|nr:DNA primase [Anaerolineae bacterium]